jgi:hypothetical protein
VVTGVSPNEWWIDENVNNDTEYCYRVIAVGSDNTESSPSNPTCATPKADPIPPTGGILINGGATTTVSKEVELTLFANDNPAEDEHEVIFDGGRRFPPRDRENAEASGVEEMMLSNDGAFPGAMWEMFASAKDWQLMDIEEGPATVYVKYRDGAGNVSDIYHATIMVLRDSDGDGIPDEEDACVDSDLTTTVVIDGCDSDVMNFLLFDGCTISDKVMECAANANNHGKFVSCVSQLTNELKKDGILTGKEKGKIMKCAATAELP